MSKLICIMLVGVPGSGKTTYVAKHLASVKADDWKVLSTDDYLAAKCVEHGIGYNDAFNLLIGDANKHLDACLVAAIADKKNIIWDQTNVSRTSRLKKLRRVPSQYTKKAIYFVPPDAVTLRKRLDSRKDKPISDMVIKNMLGMFDMPTADEGFSNIIVYDSTKIED